MVYHYRCECLSGWTGKNCSENIDDCRSHTCLNGAQCVDALGSYTCTCLTGYTGKFCEIPPINLPFPDRNPQSGVCENNDCQNNGVCYQPKGTQDYMCQCAPGKSSLFNYYT